jgi:hypothetical protein
MCTDLHSHCSVALLGKVYHLVEIIFSLWIKEKMSAKQILSVFAEWFLVGEGHPNARI